MGPKAGWLNSTPAEQTVILYDAADGVWLRFVRPERYLVARCLDEVIPLVRRIEAACSEEGLFAAGFFSYESGPAFDRALVTRPASEFPFLWFGLYREIETVPLPFFADTEGDIGELAASVDEDEYCQAIGRVRQLISTGETYQVNYTFRLRSTFSGDSWRLFRRMISAQVPGYGGYIDTGRWVICSASPELFFTRQGNCIVSKPMKGTIARGLWSAQDRGRADWLRHSDKNRAENVMIVDMVRNDLGRIAVPGSVCVPQLFEVEQYPTVWQMTSTVQAETDASLCEILRGLYPAASITGAPKVHTMSIIRDLESSPRQIYTGSLGFVMPSGRCQFNVAIRTALIDRREETLEYGVGGGIVWDSLERSEWKECYAKAAVLRVPTPDFSILETILWTPGEGFFLIERHLRRFQETARYFAFPLDRAMVETKLASACRDLSSTPHRFRLLLNRSGDLRVEASPLNPVPERPRVRLARSPTDTGNPFVYHKTTYRKAYDLALAEEPGYDDVILWNTRGQVTESCIANVVIETEDTFFTPPVQCGLLPGTFRAQMLAEGRIRERIVTIDDLRSAKRIFLLNSLRKWREAGMDWSV